MCSVVTYALGGRLPVSQRKNENIMVKFMIRMIFISPIYMILTYILLSIIGGYSYAYNYLIIYDFTLLFLCIALYGWVVVFINYMYKKYNSSTKMEYTRAKYLFLYIIFVQFIPIFIYYYGYSYNYNRNSFFNSVIVITSFCSIFYILWTASKSLLIAEMGGKAEIRDKIPTNRIIGTFFEFFYLPFFIIFLTRRLRALEKLSSGDTIPN